MNKEVSHEWIQLALRLPMGQRIYIPCLDKDTQKRDYKDILIAIRSLSQVDPVAASTLQVGKIPKNQSLWIVISHLVSNPRIGFVEDSQGNMQRIYLPLTSDFWRRTTLMKEDGLSDDDIVSLVHEELSDNQLEELQQWLKEWNELECSSHILRNKSE